MPEPNGPSSHRTHDFVAIGLGPFNLGLACLTDPIDELHGIFLERKPGFDWHPGMLLESATLQTPFLADLVTLADPTSAYSFLNYLKDTGRIYPFYIRENFFPLRSEYVDYCRWAANRVDSIRFNRPVNAVTYDEATDTYAVHTEAETYRTSRLVVGVGAQPYIPMACRGLDGAVHSSEYLDRRAELTKKPSITIVGSGQSAAEIYYDLLQEIDVHGYELVWVTRSPRFFPLEYTKLTLEMTSPAYTDFFHALPEATRDDLLSRQKGLYKGINSELINAIFDLLYQKRTPRTRLLTATALTDARRDDDRFTLGLHHEEQDETFSMQTDGLILATGYRHGTPGFLEPITDRLGFDDAGRLAVRRNYSVDVTGRAVYVQNAELHTHGFVAPDLGMAAYRNSWIISELLGREYYPIEKATTFQTFGPLR